MNSNERHYPYPCTSAYCGRTECPEDCLNLGMLRAFKAWREATKATRPDPTWCPWLWVATVNEGA